MQQRHPLIGDVRGLGLFLGIELVKDRQTRERASDAAEAVIMRAVPWPELQDHHGQHPDPHPALTISREEMDRALDILEQAIGEGERDNGWVHGSSSRLKKNELLTMEPAGGSWHYAPLYRRECLFLWECFQPRYHRGKMRSHKKTEPQGDAASLNESNR